MASANDFGSVRKRVGRKRKPALAPGPSLQFVVASHPDKFRDTETMRNVRSHVMYKHQERRGSPSSDRPQSREEGLPFLERTPSPMTTPSVATIDSRFLSPNPVTRLRSSSWNGGHNRSYIQSAVTNPFRSLVSRIISATTIAPARSAPPIFEDASEYPFSTNNVLAVECLDELKQRYINSTPFVCQDLSWMQRICNHRLTFFAHVSASCVFQDLAEGLLTDSELTLQAKTKVLGMLNNRLNVNDHEVAITSILHVLVSEVGNGEEKVFEVHKQGLDHWTSSVEQVSPRLATSMVILLLTFACLRQEKEPVMPRAVQNRASVLVNYNGPISPLHLMQSDMSSLGGSYSDRTLEIIRDMHTCTALYLSRWTATNPWSPSDTHATSHDVQLGHIHTRLLSLPSTEVDILLDWIYESCRLAALIYCRSIIHSSTLAESGRTLHTRSSGSGAHGNTLLSALHDATQRTNTSDCWGEELRGSFLWVCLIGAAAAWSPSQPEDHAQEVATTSAWARKFFALYAIRAVVSIQFEDADAAIIALQTMLRVQTQIATSVGM